MKHWLIKGYIFPYDQLCAGGLTLVKEVQEKATNFFVKLSFAG